MVFSLIIKQISQKYILLSQGLFKVRDFIKTLGTIYSLQGFYKVPREYIKSLNFQGLSKQVPENFQGVYKVPENSQGVCKVRCLTIMEHILPQVIYNPMTVIGFSAMFNFQLQIILRVNIAERCPIAVVGVVDHLTVTIQAQFSATSKLFWL